MTKTPEEHWANWCDFTGRLFDWIDEIAGRIIFNRNIWKLEEAE